MKPEQQIKALAKLDGWTFRKSASLYQSDGWWSSDGRGPFTERQMRFDGNLHRMLSSYDAIIPLIQKQSLEIRDRIATKGEPISFMATPARLAEKLLRATEKWKD